MKITAGSKLGPYEILAQIGAGGMGEVWKARDTRLDRVVAIKVSKKEFSERFEREARAVAALNHSRICQLYDVGPNYLVFEYIEGEPLKGPLPLEKALEYGGQICDALDTAHSKKITHRDLKPANILVTKQGIKLLDFGLAKIDKPVAVAQETVTMALTSQGQILGTLLYMSPEQLQGKEADSRSDIFGFGCVLYEMLTGKRAFDGASSASVIAAILERPAPSIAELAPPVLDRVLKRCLEKDPDQRWQTARDLKSALELAAVQSAPPGEISGRAMRRQWLPWMLAGAAVLAAIALAGLFFVRPTPEEPRVTRFSVPYPSETRFTTTDSPAISPDGRHLVFASLQGENPVLWVRDLDAADARALPGTDGAHGPFWSPDSHTIAFFTDDKLKSVDLSGGPVATFCDCAGGFGTWSTRDTILFSTTAGIVSLAERGGTAAQVTALESGEIAHQRPWFLPDGHHFLYTAQKLGQSPVYMADLDAADKQKSQREVRKVQTSADAGTDALFVSPDFLLFRRGTTLIAQRFDPDKAQLRGEERPVAEGVSRYSVSQNGVLVYETLDATIGRVQLTWFDRLGKIQGTVDEPRAINWPVISPDGAKLAYDAVSSQADSVDIWVHDLARGNSERATFGQVSDFPQWSPDGLHFVFRRNRALHQAAADGSGEGVLDQQEDNVRADDQSRDGRFIAEERNQSNSGDPQTRQEIWMLPGSHIWILPMSQGKPGKAFPFLRSPYTERWAKFSPDGKWLAYTSDETSRNEVYVQEFHPSPDGTSAAGGGKVRISNSGGSRPVWSRDGKELYYIAPNRKLMAVPIQAGGRGGTALNPGAPKELFQTKIAGSIDYWFDVSRDGRFIMPVRVQQSSRSEMSVVLNWPSILKK